MQDVETVLYANILPSYEAYENNEAAQVGRKIEYTLEFFHEKRRTWLPYSPAACEHEQNALVLFISKDKESKYIMYLNIRFCDALEW